MLFDSGSTGNHINNQIAHSLNSIIQHGEVYEKLTFGDGSRGKQKDVCPFDCNVDITMMMVLTWIPNILQELILRCPWF